MTDRELLRTLLFVYEWRQEDLAREMGFHRSNISKVIGEKQTLPPKRREIAEALLREVKEKKRK